MRLRSPKSRPIPIEAGRSERSFEPVTAAEPDDLRDAVREALLSLPVDKRTEFRAKLFAGLRRAGLNVRSCLLMLGVSAATTGELSAPEIASLVRYVRLTQPTALITVAASLSELLTAARSEKAPGLAA